MTHAITCTAPFVQRAGVAALTGSQTHVEDMVKVFKERRNVIVTKLNEIDGISCITPQGAFYAWPNIKEIGKSS
ncbi:MAG: aminotransferase class I/II-fold pyridoxal phosphate-dependent enzyme [Candidatus Thorarchaeota archaeon]